MHNFKNPSFSERLNRAATARKAQIEKFKAQPGADDPAVAERAAARQAVIAAREARTAERAAARQAREAAEEAARQVAAAAREAERIASEAAAAAAAAEQQARELALEAERKANRDARYAARKARNK